MHTHKIQLAIGKDPLYRKNQHTMLIQESNRNCYPCIHTRSNPHLFFYSKMNDARSNTNAWHLLDYRIHSIPSHNTHLRHAKEHGVPCGAVESEEPDITQVATTMLKTAISPKMQVEFLKPQWLRIIYVWYMCVVLLPMHTHKDPTCCSAKRS